MNRKIIQINNKQKNIIHFYYLLFYINNTLKQLMLI